MRLGDPTADVRKERNHFYRTDIQPGLSVRRSFVRQLVSKDGPVNNYQQTRRFCATSHREPSHMMGTVGQPGPLWIITSFREVKTLENCQAGNQLILAPYLIDNSS